MEVRSETRPRVTRAGIGELRRSWTPPGDPWADLVVVHGIAEHSGRHHPTASHLAEAGIAVSAFDPVGFGASAGTRSYVETWTTYLDQVEDNISAARHPDRPLALFGQSMGGLIALEYCLAERPRVDALVVCAPALHGGAAWQRAIAPLSAALASKVRLPNALKGDQLSRDPKVGEEYFADPLVQATTTTRLGAELFAAMKRVSGVLDRLGVPTLVLHGGLDTIVPPISTAPMADLPTVERRLYPALRHEVLNEPEGPEVLAGIVAWLRLHLTMPPP